jgi:energy-coupling factor transporter ATP-binding protein EcfA2
MITFDQFSGHAGDGQLFAHLTGIFPGPRTLVSGVIGSGKTLLARGLCGLYRTSETISFQGSCLLNGIDAFKDVPSDRLPRMRPRIWLVPQSTYTGFFGLTVEEELASSLLFNATSRENYEATLNRWAGRSPLAELRFSSPLSLSGGQQRILGVECAILAAPEVIIVDGGLLQIAAEGVDYIEALIGSWLEGDTARHLIMTSSSPDSEWLKFDDTIHLSGTSKVANPVQFSRSKSVHEPSPSTSVHELSSGTPVLAFRDVTLQYRGRISPAVVHFSASFFGGDLVALLGPNGIGKSTLFRAIAGTAELMEGTIDFLGRDFRSPYWPGLRSGFAFVPQEPELAASVFTLRRISGGESTNGIEFAEYWTKSSGERIRFLIQALLRFRPRAVVLDEPTTRLEIREVWALLAEYRESNPLACLIIITHDERVARQLPFTRQVRMQ